MIGREEIPPMSPCPILNEVKPAGPQQGEQGFKTGFGGAVEVRSVVDHEVQWLAELGLPELAQARGVRLINGPIGFHPVLDPLV